MLRRAFERLPRGLPKGGGFLRTGAALRKFGAKTFISEDERYLFDLNGFLVVKGVFSSEEVRDANLAIDTHLAQASERQDPGLRNTRDNTPLSGDGKTGRIDLGGFLGWKKPYCDPFRNVLANQRLIPYYHEFVGEGYRLDHQPLVIIQDKGSEGFCMHGGTIDCTSGEYNQHLAYACRNGRMTNALLGVSVQLSEHNEGDGGFMIVRGSHKSNFSMPKKMIHGELYNEHIHQPVTEPGDVVIFSEGTVHGAKAWKAEHQRRIALFRFAPCNMAYGRSYTPLWPQEVYESMRDEEKAVLEPPYSARLDRPVQTLDGTGVKVGSRSAKKMEHDKTVFGTTYF